MTHTTNLGASSPLPEGGKSLRIPIKRQALRKPTNGCAFRMAVSFSDEVMKAMGFRPFAAGEVVRARFGRLEVFAVEGGHRWVY